MPYRLPPDVSALTGACAFDHGLCVWAGRTAYRWGPAAGWTALSAAPTSVDSGFRLQSGVLAGADTHVGFLPADGTDWAWWADLSAFSDAHPMYGDLLLCTDRDADTTYHLFSISTGGLERRSRFDAEELAEPVAGWSSPPTPERLLLLGDGGLWALDPPYTPDALQHLVSFDDVALPALADIPGPFQPGVATVVIPRRSRTALRLDLSDGTGRATGLKHLPGGTALWTAYLNDDRAAAARLWAALTALPAPADDANLHLLDVLRDGDDIAALATSAGLHVPDERPDAAPVSASPLDADALATWALWLGADGAPATAGRRLCAADADAPALAEALQVFAGAEAGHTLFALLRGDDPPPRPDDYSRPALRTLAATLGPDAAPLVADGLSAAAVPARVAACAMAGTTAADRIGAPSPSDAAPAALLWPDASSLPAEALRSNARHDHPAVRAAAREACDRLGLRVPPAASADGADYSRRSVQSSQPESPK
jgi:hypothetical protein